jgi:hypothetical protein
MAAKSAVLIELESENHSSSAIIALQSLHCKPRYKVAQGHRKEFRPNIKREKLLGTLYIYVKKCDP